MAAAITIKVIGILIKALIKENTILLRSTTAMAAGIRTVLDMEARASVEVDSIGRIIHRKKTVQATIVRIDGVIVIIALDQTKEAPAEDGRM